ncbi:MAG TPA: L-threonylcarbamoyladenylate synthase [Ignavibacteria bacterium]|nr:L-threonylcarbamoyladenylate synthase [Ignavibacteria bacterium]
MTLITKDIDTAVKELLSGNVVGLPTETVYGLGADALNEKAVLKIYETKERPAFNPVIVHVFDIENLGDYAISIPDEAYNLAEKFSPGPLTFIFKKGNKIPDIVTAGNDSVGLRIPSHPVFREVLKETNLPVAAPSANRAGRISPTSAEDVMSELKDRINFILDGGKCRIGIESTIISFTGEYPEILRHGFVTKEDIENVIGKTKEYHSGKIISPGQLKSHYAPSTPLLCEDDLANVDVSDKKTGLLDFSKYSDYKEIALNLFSDLRKLDEQNYDIILWKKLKDEGLGIAINDRLSRASVSASYEQ